MVYSKDTIMVTHSPLRFGIIVLILAILVLFFVFMFSKQNQSTVNNEPNSRSSTNKNGGLEITSPAFRNNQSIPARYTCNGRDIHPPLSFAKIPPNTRILVLMAEDPDAPSKPFTHWLAWNLIPNIKLLEEGRLPDGSLEGQNDFGLIGYNGPCPATGTHHYHFKVYALDIPLVLNAGISKEQLDAAIAGHVIEEATLIGTYKKH